MRWRCLPSSFSPLLCHRLCSISTSTTTAGDAHAKLLFWYVAWGRLTSFAIGRYFCEFRISAVFVWWVCCSWTSSHTPKWMCVLTSHTTRIYTCKIRQRRVVINALVKRETPKIIRIRRKKLIYRWSNYTLNEKWLDVFTGESRGEGLLKLLCLVCVSYLKGVQELKKER